MFDLRRLLLLSDTEPKRDDTDLATGLIVATAGLETEVVSHEGRA